jgi:virginiamycin B lyase
MEEQMSARNLRPLLVALLLVGSASAYSQTNLPEGAGREIVQNTCGGCHELTRVLRSGYSAQDWQTVVHMMKNVGAQVPDDELPILVKYLADNFPENGYPLHTRSTAGRGGLPPTIDLYGAGQMATAC